MPAHYKVVAARKGKKFVVRCSSARSAIVEQKRLALEGWGVCVADEDGIPQSDNMMRARAAAEASPDWEP